MNRYLGTKAVNATPMTRAAYNTLRGWTLPADENGDDAGYLVEYTDGGKPNHPGFAGYISWSPKEQFDKAYRPTTALTFGLALEAMKLGKKMQREGWNGKGLWVQFWKSTSSCDLPHLMLMYPVNSYQYPLGARVPWTPSQTDQLAEDWTVLP